jgi:hypothetical protein
VKAHEGKGGTSQSMVRGLAASPWRGRGAPANPSRGPAASPWRRRAGGGGVGRGRGGRQVDGQGEVLLLPVPRSGKGSAVGREATEETEVPRLGARGEPGSGWVRPVRCWPAGLGGWRWGVK